MKILYSSHLAIISLFLIFLETAPNLHTQTLTATEIFNKVVHSVVKVYSFDFDEIEISQGSGVVIEKDVLVTNYHVFDGGSKLEIEHFDKRYNEVKILFADPKIDLLVLLVNNLTLDPIEIADSNDIIIGEKIYAIGSPEGFENTITEGIISGIRNWNESIQISAGITHGSSGGAVVNEKGKLIGISTRGQEVTNINLNFAIPASYVLNKTKWCNKDDANCINQLFDYFKAYNLITETSRMLNISSSNDLNDKLNLALKYITKALEIEANMDRAQNLLFFIINKYPFKGLNKNKLTELNGHILGFDKFIDGVEMIENNQSYFTGFDKIIDAINMNPRQQILLLFHW